MEFRHLEILGTAENYRIALFKGVLVIRRVPTTDDYESGIVMAAATLCPGVYVERGQVLASINVNGYDELVMRYQALVNNLKDWIDKTRNHAETHRALGV